MDILLFFFCPSLSAYWRSNSTTFLISTFLYFFFSSDKFVASLLVLAYTLLECGGATSDQSDILCVGNFRGLGAGTVDGPPWCDFPSPGGCLHFQKKHECTLLPRTCSVCSRFKIFIIFFFFNYAKMRILSTILCIQIPVLKEASWQ